MKKIFTLFCFLLSFVMASAAVTITKTQGWFESGYVTWQTTEGLTYSVYVRPEGGEYTQLDNDLVRNYGTYGRADMVGLKAGKYQFKVVASNSEEAESEVFTAVAHDRSGFAHDNWPDGIGAYKNDGTLKDNARVIYVNANTAKTVKCFVKGDKDVEYTGLQTILAAFEKGKETRPLAVRIVGTIKAEDMDALKSTEEGLQVKGKSGYSMNITIEGIGNDAAIYDFGILLRNATSVELRNFAVMMCMDDCISIDTDNHHCWVHSMDYFYGKVGGEADQAKGDGTVDIKGKSSHITVSYNHFFDSGKCSLGGMKSETTDCWMSYHHNWFDHSDSRHPRIRTAFYHVYNNYFDGNSKYGTGVTMGGSAFCESNYFRTVKYPFLSSKQGTEAEGDGTFSGEDGGVIKAFNNKIINPKKVQYWSAEVDANGKWDAYLASSRDENVSVKALAGGTEYNNAATTAAIAAVPASALDPVEDVALICRGEKAGRPGAGRCDGGDFKWTFKYSAQDTNDKVIADLKQSLIDYKSTLVGLFTGETSIKNGGATATVDSGDGKGLVQSIGDDTYNPYGQTQGGGDDGDLGNGTPIYNLTGSIGTTTNNDAASFTAGSSFKLGGNSQYVVITPKAGESFKNGDIVKIKGSCGSDSKKMGLYLATSADGRTSGTGIYVDAPSKGTTYEATGKLSLTEDVQTLYLFRYDGTSTTITSLEILRPDPTALDEIDGVSVNTSKVVYDLMGRKSIDGKGLKVVGGKTVLVK